MVIEKIKGDEYFSIINNLPIAEDEKQILLSTGYYCEYKKQPVYISLRTTFFRESLVWNIVECTNPHKVRDDNYDVLDYTLTEAIHDFLK